MKIEITKDIKIAVDCRTTLSFKKGEIKDNLEKVLTDRLIQIKAAKEMFTVR